MIAAGGFHPHWVSTLYLGVHVCFMCDDLFYFYCTWLLFMYGSDALIKDQYMMN